MSISINSRIESIQISGIRQFSNQLIDYPEAINLTIGQPDFPTPEAVKQAAIIAIQNNQTSYTHNAGLLDLRAEIASFFQDTYALEFNPQTEVIVTNGASEGLDSLFRAILEEGDEVILPAPAYPGYEPIIQLCGGKVVYLDTSDTGFQPDPKRLESLITDRTKAVLMNFPSNPTGVTMESVQLEKVAAVLEKHEVFIVTDEIYSENSYGEKHTTFARFEKLRNRTFLVHGLSKSHSMTGWRIGFVLGPEMYMKHVLKVHQYNAICAAVPSQYAALEAMKNQRHIPAEMNIEYIKRRDFVYKRLTDMGIDVVLPKGAFYIFPSIEKFGMTSFDFAMRLLKEGGVAAVPGSAFTKYGEGFVRISYAYSMTVLEEGMNRLEQFIQTLKSSD
ncbi:aminotransferase class I/II-fold pyridoxal phosphate-dependent enzyme [Planococcus halocryophilus]|uniref:aminotransferase class I/II-fold pyridoxal phosphate-dependent enzyme n=1 Tax=Planococcus halocryophilus TaxID=1215089 RepID=UPI001F103775|nr:aminotransferase class I/II-fold pyridoxal phosphate-dependent enzyme [Planococcus halocryophilus]MCH4824741.1 aminotransferase class I/II-fold pyridoxal phosphate-dependent enzyme [Planococcus halocryophilus]